MDNKRAKTYSSSHSLQRMDKRRRFFGADPFFRGLTFALVCGAFACTQQLTPPRNTEAYATAFPNDNYSRELRKLTQTVRKVYFSVYYDKYVFPVQAQIEPGTIDDRLLEEAAWVEPMVHPVSATATVIFYKHPKIALLSCAHVFDSPDTITTYFADDSADEYIQSIAIKKSEKIVVPGFKSGSSWQILLEDRERDIAILGRELVSLPSTQVTVFPSSVGRSKELGWGASIYLLGFPSGVKTITSGIVSQPDKDGQGSFLIDALFNPGSSGGIVLATRDGSSRFELVGMAVSVSGHEESVLVPTEDKEYDETTPFEGKISVRKRTIVDYGITQVVSSEAIAELLNQNRSTLISRGYNINFYTP
jgi:hypothetical protein